MAGWYYARAGQQLGPVDLTQLRAMLSAGQVAPEDLVWTEGMAQWQAARHVPPVMPPGGPPTAVPYQSGYPLYDQPSQHSALAITSLVLSLLSIVLGGPLLAIPGWICARIALKGMRETGDYRNQGIAQAGYWIGMIVSIFWILLIVLFLVMVIVAGATR